MRRYCQRISTLFSPSTVVALKYAFILCLILIFAVPIYSERTVRRRPAAGKEYTANQTAIPQVVRDTATGKRFSRINISQSNAFRTKWFGTTDRFRVLDRVLHMGAAKARVFARIYSRMETFSCVVSVVTHSSQHGNVEHHTVTTSEHYSSSDGSSQTVNQHYDSSTGTTTTTSDVTDSDGDTTSYYSSTCDDSPPPDEPDDDDDRPNPEDPWGKFISVYEFRSSAELNAFRSYMNANRMNLVNAAKNRNENAIARLMVAGVRGTALQTANAANSVISRAKAHMTASASRAHTRQ
ncbi:MAG: hypothetical protein JXA20_08030 [Spirochaetes bacterium]|nr:hypothetical protein [Spirochaetota bacterium]